MSFTLLSVLEIGPEDTAAGTRRRGFLRRAPCGWPTGRAIEKDAKLAHPQPFTAVFPQECLGQLAYFGPTADTFLAAGTAWRGWWPPAGRPA